MEPKTMVRVACGGGVSLVRDGINGIGEKGDVETLSAWIPKAKEAMWDGIFVQFILSDPSWSKALSCAQKVIECPFMGSKHFLWQQAFFSFSLGLARDVVDTEFATTSRTLDVNLGAHMGNFCLIIIKNYYCCDVSPQILVATRLCVERRVPRVLVICACDWLCAGGSTVTWP